MAFIWTGKRLHNNNENVGLASPAHFKQFSSARKLSVRKNAFGELTNGIHNQGAATPFKGAGKNFIHNHGAATPFNGAGKNFIHNQGAATPFGPSKTLCADVLRKQQMKQHFTEAQRFLEKKLNPTTKARPSCVKIANTIETTIYEDFIDFEVPVNTCTGECSKSLEQIWDDMNVIDEEFLDKVINGGDPDSDTEDSNKDQFKWSDDDDEEIVEEVQPEWNVLHVMKMPTLPDCDFDIPLLEETKL